MDKKFKYPLAAQFLLYVFQYLVVPIFYKVYPSDVSTISVVMCITTFLVVICCELLFPVPIKLWFFSLWLYPVLIILYHPFHLYGIGYTDFVPPVVNIIALSIEVYLFQTVALVGTKFFRKGLFKLFDIAHK